MKPRAMTRDIDWGIPVPLAGWEENPAKRLYVWFDAVIGYLSASVEWARRSGDDDAWRAWWTDPSAESYYFMGKDNITFHSQIWPAELLAYDGRGSRGGEPGRFGNLNLPTEVVASEFLTMEGKQFSSSRGVVIHVRDVLARYQPDALRYFISAAGPENNDSDFTWQEFATRATSELVAGWGNLVNRTASLIAKNVGEIPAAGELTDADRTLLDTTRAGFGVVGDLIEHHRQRAGLGEAMRVVGEVNKYLTDQEPWKIKNSDPDRMRTVLHVTAQAVSDCRTLLSPYLPHSAQKVHEAFGGTGTVSPLPELREVTDLDDGRPYPVLTATTAGARPCPPGVRRRSCRGRRSPRRRRSSPSSTSPRSSRRNSRGCSSDGTPTRTGTLAVPVADNHTHLDSESEEDVEALLAAAAAAGVPRSVQIGCDLPAARWTVAALDRHPQLLGGVALHPNEVPDLVAAGEYDAALAEIATLARHPRVRVVGETGLDHFRTPPEQWHLQEESFRAHIALAKELGLALQIHDRDAHDDVLRVLARRAPPSAPSSTASPGRRHGARLRRRGVLPLLRRHRDVQERG